LAAVFWAFGVPALFAAFVMTGSRSFLQAFYAGTLCLLLVALLKGLAGRAVSLPAGPVVPYGLLLLLLGVSTLRADLFLPFSLEVEQFRSLLGLVLWTVVMVLVPQFLRSAQDIKTLLRFLDLSGLVIAATVFAGFAGLDFGEALSSEGGRRAFGPLGDQVGFVLSFFAVRAIVLRHWLRFGYFSLAIMATGTRGALLVALLGIALALALDRDSLRGGYSPQRKSRVVAFVLVVLTITLLFTTPIAAFLVERLTSPEFIGATALHRLGAMSLAIDIAADYPWLGVGFHGYSGAAWSYNPLFYFPVALDPSILEVLIASVSNQYLQTLTDGGVFALILLAWLILQAISTLHTTRRSCGGELRRDATALLCWVVALPLANQTACWLLPQSLIGYMWFLCVGIGIALLPIAATDRPGVSSDRGVSGPALSSVGPALSSRRI
jgi:hypothetical protein